MTLKELIESERSITGETQVEFCRRANIGTNTLAKINRGEKVRANVKNRIVKACMAHDETVREGDVSG